MATSTHRKIYPKHRVSHRDKPQRHFTQHSDHVVNGTGYWAKVTPGQRLAWMQLRTIREDQEWTLNAIIKVIGADRRNFLKMFSKLEELGLIKLEAGVITTYDPEAKEQPAESQQAKLKPAKQEKEEPKLIEPEVLPPIDVQTDSDLIAALAPLRQKGYTVYTKLKEDLINALKAHHSAVDDEIGLAGFLKVIAENAPQAQGEKCNLVTLFGFGEPSPDKRSNIRKIYLAATEVERTERKAKQAKLRQEQKQSWLHVCHDIELEVSAALAPKYGYAPYVDLRTLEGRDESEIEYMMESGIYDLWANRDLELPKNRKLVRWAAENAYRRLAEQGIEPRHNWLTAAVYGGQVIGTSRSLELIEAVIQQSREPGFTDE